MSSSSKLLPTLALWSTHITAPAQSQTFKESVTDERDRRSAQVTFTSTYACPYWAKQFKVFKAQPDPLDWVSAANMCQTHKMNGQRAQLATIRSSQDWAAFKRALSGDWRTPQLDAAWIGAWRPDSRYQWIGMPKEPAFCDPSASYINWPSGQDRACAKITKANTINNSQCTGVQLSYYVCEFCAGDAPTDPCAAEPTDAPPIPSPMPTPAGANYGNYRPCSSDESVRYTLVKNPTNWYGAERKCLGLEGGAQLPSNAISGTSALATVRSYTEWLQYEAVFQSTSDQAWVGAMWSGEGPNSMWVPPPQTAVALTVFPWKPYQPSSQGGGNCVSGSKLGAFNGDCDAWSNFICQYCVSGGGQTQVPPGPTVVIPPPHHMGCKHDEVKKYEFFSMAKSWTAAQDYCASKKGGHAPTSVCPRSTRARGLDFGSSATFGRVSRHSEGHGGSEFTSETSHPSDPCRISSAGLATVESHAEQHILDDLGMDTLVWIGGSDRQTEGQWKWSTGEPISGSFAWGPNQPTHQGDCLALHAADGSSVNLAIAGYERVSRSAGMSSHGARNRAVRHSSPEGTWEDQDCALSLPFVCEYCVPAPPRPSCPSGTVKEYEYFSERVTWDQAQAMCEAGTVRRATGRHSVIKGVLATVESASDFAYLDSLTHDLFWIGGNDKAVDGKWVWTSGEYIIDADDYWGAGQPSSGDCIAMDASGNQNNNHGRNARHSDGSPGHWQTENCLAKLPYVCQYCVAPTSCENREELLNGVCVPCSRPNTIHFADMPGCVAETCVNRYEVDDGVCVACSRPNTISFVDKPGCVAERCVNKYEVINGRCVACSRPNTVGFENKPGCVPNACSNGYQVVNGVCKREDGTDAPSDAPEPEPEFTCTCFGKQPGFYPIVKSMNVIVRGVRIDPNSVLVYCDGYGNALIQNQASSSNNCMNQGYGAVNSRLGPDSCGYLALEFVQELARKSDSVTIVDEAVGTMEATGTGLNTPVRALQDATSWQSDAITSQFTNTSGRAFNFDRGCTAADDQAFGWPNMFNSCGCENNFRARANTRNVAEDCVNWNRVNRHSARTVVAESSSTSLRMRDTNEMCSGAVVLPGENGRRVRDAANRKRRPVRVPRSRVRPRRRNRGTEPRNSRRNKPSNTHRNRGQRNSNEGRVARSVGDRRRGRNRAVSEETAAGSTTASDNGSCTVGGIPCWALYVTICGVVITGVAAVLAVSWRMKNKKQKQVAGNVVAATTMELKSVS